MSIDGSQFPAFFGGKNEGGDYLEVSYPWRLRSSFPLFLFPIVLISLSCPPTSFNFPKENCVHLMTHFERTEQKQFRHRFYSPKPALVDGTNRTEINQIPNRTQPYPLRRGADALQSNPREMSVKRDCPEVHPLRCTSGQSHPFKLCGFAHASLRQISSCLHRPGASQATV